MIGRELFLARLLRGIGVAALIGGLVFLVTFQLQKVTGEEKIYESTAILQVALPAAAMTSEEKDEFLSREISQMTSDEILGPVASSLELAKKWELTPAQSLVLLRGQTDVSDLAERRSRARFSIAVRNADAELARTIAAEIATEYQRQGNAKAQLAYRQELEELTEKIAAQERLVEEKRARLNAL